MLSLRPTIKIKRGKWRGFERRDVHLVVIVCLASRPGSTFSADPTAFEGPIAQWLEQRTHNPLVPGSSPGGPTTFFSKMPWVLVRYSTEFPSIRCSLECFASWKPCAALEIIEQVQSFRRCPAVSVVQAEHTEEELSAKEKRSPRPHMPRLGLGFACCSGPTPPSSDLLCLWLPGLLTRRLQALPRTVPFTASAYSI